MNWILNWCHYRSYSSPLLACLHVSASVVAMLTILQDFELCRRTIYGIFQDFELFRSKSFPCKISRESAGFQGLPCKCLWNFQQLELVWFQEALLSLPEEVSPNQQLAWYDICSCSCCLVACVLWSLQVHWCRGRRQVQRMRRTCRRACLPWGTRHIASSHIECKPGLGYGIGTRRCCGFVAQVSPHQETARPWQPLLGQRFLRDTLQALAQNIMGRAMETEVQCCLGS